MPENPDPCSAQVDQCCYASPNFRRFNALLLPRVSPSLLRFEGRVLQGDISAANALGDGLGARAGIQFGHQGTNMELDSMLGYAQAPGDLFVPHTFSEQAQHFAFPVGDPRI